MPSSKRKKNQKRRRKSKHEKSSTGTVQNAQPLHQRDDRHKLIALTLASLVAGLLAIINLDRATHSDSLTKEERMVSTSRHGWPLVYLERDVADKPEFFFSKRLYSWPIPAIEGEQRRWNLGNFAGNVGIAVAITAASFALISFFVFKYDCWKKTLQRE